MNQELVLGELIHEDHQATLAIINWLSNCQTRNEFNQVLETALIPLLNCSGIFYMRQDGEKQTPQLLGSINQSNCCPYGWERFLQQAVQMQVTGSAVINSVTPRLATHSFQCDNLNYRPYPLSSFQQTIDRGCTIVTLIDAPGQNLKLCFCRLDTLQQCYSQRDTGLLKMLQSTLLQTIRFILFWEESLSCQKIMANWPNQAEPMAILCDDDTTIFQNIAFEQIVQKEDNRFLSTVFSVIRIIKQKKMVWHSFLSKLGERLYEITLTLVNKGGDNSKCTYCLRLSRITNQVGKIFSRLNSVGLTTRELEIAMLIYQGTSTREIAEQIHLSYHTVRNYLKSIYSKLGVSTRSEMLVWVG